MPARGPARAPDSRTSVPALVRFSVLWVIAGAASATLLILVLDRTESPSLPPLGEARLEVAARDAGCRLKTGGPDHRANFANAVSRGVVVIRHSADLPEDRAAQLELVRRRVPTATIIAVNPAASAPMISATAWRRSLTCERFTPSTLDALRLFRARYLGRGPEAD